MSQTRWVTFDCFGTLIDWRHGIATGAELIAPGNGEQLLDAYHRHEADVLAANPTMRYRDALAETLRRAASDEGVALLQDDLSVLAATIPYWPAFSDVGPALTELRDAGWRLALLTNCDRDIIGETQRRLPVPFDAVITAEHVGSYKPAHAHFTRFEASYDVTRDRWVHVAQGYAVDMVPAGELHIPRVWINRLDARGDPSIADVVRSDLEDLITAVETAHAIARQGEK